MYLTRRYIPAIKPERPKDPKHLKCSEAVRVAIFKLKNNKL